MARLRRLRSVFVLGQVFFLLNVYTPKQIHFLQCTHQADAPNTRLCHRTLAHLGRLLAEEEIQLVVVPFGTVRDEVHVDKCGVCDGQIEENI